MISVGTDLIEIKRIEKSIKRAGFLKRILGNAEYLELKNRNFPIQSVAANFCAKEAFLKSVGKGLGEVDLRSIEVLREKSGKPYFKLTNINWLDKSINFSVSITHTKEYALAFVVAEHGNKNEED
ncbi:MAG: Holo-[acyl-carrier-protein] synthase [Eubacteriales bacterium SKADARSKE-1]|nr:Holo-[acyl-carrier-protein] synthase [Eubacteriales bacterium SKADARSKE-1]